MNNVLRVALCAVLLAVCTMAIAAEPPPPPKPPAKPWFPFPELPAVLWCEDFDNAASLVKYGKVNPIPKNEAAEPIPGAKPVALEEIKFLPAEGNGVLMGEVGVVGSNQKFSMATFNLAATKLKIPGVYRPTDLALYFLCWAEEAGVVEITFTSGLGSHEVIKPIHAGKAWIPVTAKVSDFAGRGGRAKIEEIFTELKIMFRPRTSQNFQKVYVDNIMITAGVPKPQDILPAVDAARKRAKEIEKITARDGFSFSEQASEKLRSEIKSSAKSRKTKSVLVMAPHPGDGAEFAKALSAAAAQAKVSGYTFVPGSSPDDSPVGGLEDMRAMLKYNLDNTDAGIVLLALGYGDARAIGSAGESVRVLIDRIFDAGCVPIVSIPPSLSDPSITNKAKVDEIKKSVGDVCALRGVTLIESTAAFKNVGSPVANGELNNAGLVALASACAQVFKHYEAHYFNHR